MGELKPLGSEKLSSDAKLKRILELTYYQSSSDSKKSTEVVTETKNGVYGIVKEKDGYYVKRGLNENSLDYIGGLFMKNKNRFSSYGEAFKKAEFLAEQEKIQEAVKYVLKSPNVKPQEEAPMPMPTNEPPVPPATTDNTSMPPSGEGTPTTPEDMTGNEETPEPEGEEDYLKVIQKLSSKLQQKLDAYKEKLESKDIKAAIMQVLSGVDFDKLEEPDMDEILDKFFPEDSESEPASDETLPSDETGGDNAPAEDELGEVDGNTALEELISTNFDDPYDPSFSDPIDDEDEIEPLDFEDPEASKYSKTDFESENPEENEDMVGLSDLANELPDDDLELKKDFFSNKEEEADEQIQPTSADGDVKELDIDELTNAVNMSVKETLGKYFE